MFSFLSKLIPNPSRSGMDDTDYFIEDLYFEESSGNTLPKENTKGLDHVSRTNSVMRDDSGHLTEDVNRASSTSEEPASHARPLVIPSHIVPRGRSHVARRARSHAVHTRTIQTINRDENCILPAGEVRRIELQNLKLEKRRVASQSKSTRRTMRYHERDYSKKNINPQLTMTQRHFIAPRNV